VEALARTPIDQYVIWNGRPRQGRARSLLTQVLAYIATPWSPVPMRGVVRTTARLSGDLGLRPDAVRKAIWGHQSASPASYFLVRAGMFGEYVAVTDIPRPSSWPRPVRPGDRIMSPGERLDHEPQAGPAPAGRTARPPRRPAAAG
jgi:hypothetical protein